MSLDEKSRYKAILKRAAAADARTDELISRLMAAVVDAEYAEYLCAEAQVVAVLTMLHFSGNPTPGFDPEEVVRVERFHPPTSKVVARSVRETRRRQKTS